MRIRRNLILRALIPASLATALLCSGATATPCAHWLGGLLTKPVIGADLPVYAMTYWNPGNGSPPLLVAGGTFGFMNGVNAQYIAAWDGLVWRPLGNSIPGPVFSLTVFNGQLVAGGTRSTLSSGQQPWVARWTGAAWLDLGGVSGSPDTVYALAVYNGSLIAGGKFDGLCPNIESYDGSSWHPMGAGTDGPVRCLKVYNNTLYAGGIFKTAYPATVKNFASWNGTTWSGVGIGNPYMPTGPVYSMALHGGELFVGQGPPVPSTAVVRWNGSNWNGATGICSTVRALEESNGILYAGGDFWVQPGCPANHVAQWTGSGWTSAGTGISTGGVGPGIGVLVLKDYGGTLFAGGDFLGSSLNNIAAWNGSWQSPYAPSNVYCIAGYGSKVAMGGYFYDYNLGGYYLVNWDGTGR